MAVLKKRGKHFGGNRGLVEAKEPKGASAHSARVRKMTRRTAKVGTYGGGGGRSK